MPILQSSEVFLILLVISLWLLSILLCLRRYSVFLCFHKRDVPFYNVNLINEKIEPAQQQQQQPQQVPTPQPSPPPPPPLSPLSPVSSIALIPVTSQSSAVPQSPLSLDRHRLFTCTPTGSSNQLNTVTTMTTTHHHHGPHPQLVDYPLYRSHNLSTQALNQSMTALVTVTNSQQRLAATAATSTTPHNIDSRI